MTTDEVVFVTVVTLVGYYGFYTLGQEKAFDKCTSDVSPATPAARALAPSAAP
jgi:hypothetical protein